MENIITLPIGDWSEDGHGECVEIDVKVNYPVETLQQAYRDSCKLTGLQFNHNKNFSGLPEHDKYGTWRHICTEYEDDSISEEALEILKEHGLDDNYLINEQRFESSSHFAKILLWFIGLSIPNDFNFEIIKKNKIYLNGFWGKLNVQFGYGLFY